MKQNVLFLPWILPFTIEADTINEILETLEHIKHERDHVGYWWEDGWRGLPV